VPIGENQAMSAEEWIARDAARVWHGFTQMAAYPGNEPVIVERAEGHELIDVDGKRYLDAISSVWVSTLGHRVPELDEALADQAGRFAHSTMLGNGSRPVVELAEALAEVVPVDDPHFLFASDGAAAVEQALRIAFQYWVNVGERGRVRYLAIENAYHGDTLGALSVGADGFGVDLYDPLRCPVARAPGYGDPRWAERASELVARHAWELAAVVLEPLVQGAAGIRLARPDDYAPLVDACAEHDVLLVCDEVATGFGRTGTLFASEQCGLRPDIMCIGKGLTGGYLPMAATAASRRVYDAFLGDDLGPRTLYHGHSYGGNALAAAVALRHLALMRERGILANVAARSAELAGLLEDCVAPLRGVADVRVQGLMCGVELETRPDTLRARRICAGAVRRGVLLRSIGNVIVIVPPLSITSGELARIVDTLREAIEAEED
jgi:adenosylmethionine-8-amino-7-oxononanoate aminotransferase